MRFLPISATIAARFGGSSVSVEASGDAMRVRGNTTVTIAGAFGTFAGGPLPRRTNSVAQVRLEGIDNLGGSWPCSDLTCRKMPQ